VSASPPVRGDVCCTRLLFRALIESISTGKIRAALRRCLNAVLHALCVRDVAKGAVHAEKRHPVAKTRWHLHWDDSKCRTALVSLSHLHSVSLWVDLFIRERLDGLPPDVSDLKIGNAIYSIRFEDREKRPLFGHRYWFFLKDAVENVPEYIVRWDNFVQYAPLPSLFFRDRSPLHAFQDGSGIPVIPNL